LYDDEAHLKDGLSQDLVMKLIPFADKYQQYDLRDRCSELLKYNLNSNNAMKAFELADQVRLPRLKNACIEIIKNIDKNTILTTIQFLEKHDNSEIKANAISFVLDNLETLSGDLTLYENFLVKNFGVDTIVLFAKYAYAEGTKEPAATGLFASISFFDMPKITKKVEGKWVAELSKDGTTDLKTVLVNFGTKHLQEMKDKEGVLQDLPKVFLEELVSSVLFNKGKELSN